MVDTNLPTLSEASTKISVSEESKQKLVLDRHALHACRLRFFHPMRNETIEIEAPLPQDLRALIGE